MPSHTPLGHHRAPSWAPRVTQQVPTNYLFYTRSYIHICHCYLPNLSHLSSPPLHVHVCSLCLCLYSVQFSSAQSCPTLCDPMNRRTPGLPVHHQLLEFTQTHVHWVGDAIQPSHPLLSPSPTVPNPSQHQGLFQWVNSLYEVAVSLLLPCKQALCTIFLESTCMQPYTVLVFLFLTYFTLCDSL